MTGVNLSAEVAAIKEASKHRDREIRDLKNGMKEANEKLDTVMLSLAKLEKLPERVADLTTDRDEKMGAIKLGKWIVGTGVFGVLGSACYGIWELFRGH